MTGLKLYRNFVVMLMVTLAASAVSQAQTIRLPPHEKVVFKNGLTVLLLEKQGVPIVNFIALVKTGAAADPSGEEGLASITAELLRKGTEKRSAQQFASEVDFTGGSFEAGAGSDFSMASAEFLNKDLTKGLDLLSDALLHPAFPQAGSGEIAGAEPGWRAIGQGRSKVGAGDLLQWVPLQRKWIWACRKWG